MKSMTSYRLLYFIWTPTLVLQDILIAPNILLFGASLPWPNGVPIIHKSLHLSDTEKGTSLPADQTLVKPAVFSPLTKSRGYVRRGAILKSSLTSNKTF